MNITDINQSRLETSKPLNVAIVKENGYVGDFDLSPDFQLENGHNYEFITSKDIWYVSCDGAIEIVKLTSNSQMLLVSIGVPSDFVVSFDDGGFTYTLIDLGKGV